MMMRVDSGTLARRGFHIPPAAMMRAMRTGAGRRAVVSLAGLGATPAAAIDSMISAFLVDQSIPAGFSEADLRANITNDVNTTCRTWPEECTGNIQALIDNAVARGAAHIAQLQQQQQSFNQSELQYCNVTFDEGNQYAYMCPPGTRAASAPIRNVPPPASSPNGGGGSTAYTVPPTVLQPVATSSAVPTGGGTATNAQNTPVQATLRNLSRPNQPLQPGDAWSLTINGAPSAAVAIAGSQNGVSKGITPVGSTDSSGTKVVSGQMTTSEIGSWAETITVGNGTPATVSFSVVAAPASPGPTGGGGSTDTGNQSAPGGGATGGTTGGTTLPAASDTSGGLDTSKLLLYGGLAAAALFLLGGRR